MCFFHVLWFSSVRISQLIVGLLKKKKPSFQFKHTTSLIEFMFRRKTLTDSSTLFQHKNRKRKILLTGYCFPYGNFLNQSILHGFFYRIAFVGNW